MSETLPNPEGEQLSPMQWLGEHIEATLQGQPVDPDTAYQHTRRYINGDKHYPVAYVRNQSSGLGVVAITVRASKATEKAWRKNRPNTPKPASEIIITYDPSYRAYVPGAATEADQEQRALSQEAKINYLRSIEPFMTDRPYGIFGSIAVLLSTRGKARYPKQI